MKLILINGKDTTVRLERYPSALPTQQQIELFEGKLGYVLPPDYREFLLRYNGGVCELKNVIVPVSGYLCDLFGLYQGDPEGNLMPLKLPADEELMELWGELPEGLLPIGEVDSGDMIAIRFWEGASEVVVVDHEDDQFGVLVAERSFTDFLLNTKREEE